MKIKSDYILREVAGSYIVVPTGNARVNFNGMVTVNEVGAFLWKLLETDTDTDALLGAVLAEYDVSREQAEADLAKFIEKLRAQDILEGE